MDMVNAYIATLPIYAIQYGVANTGVHNISSRPLSPVEQLTLGLSLKHVPQPPLTTQEDVRASIANLARQIRLRHMFVHQPARKPDLLRLPNPEFSPAPATWPYEQYLDAVKSKLLTEVHDSPVRYSRLPAPMRLALRTLREDDSIIIKPADKNLGTAIVDTTWYINEARRQLGDAKVYRRLDDARATIRQSYAYLRLLLKHAGELFQPNKSPRQLTSLAKFLLQDDKASGATNESRISKFYLIIKMHKTPIAGRPIVSTCASHSAAAARWVDVKLQPIMRKQRSYIQDSSDLLLTIETTTLPQDITLLTADVESLYPSIPLYEALSKIRTLLYNDPEWGNNKDTWLLMEILQWVLFNNVFDFGNTSWLQLRGTAMGSPLAVVFANLYLACLESELLASLDFQPYIYKRFIDDVFVVLPPGSTMVSDFMSGFNSLSPTINLTHETGNCIPFLDLQIAKGSRFRCSGLLDVSLHQKALNMYLYISPTSYHPPHVFPAFIKSELMRACRNSSSSQDFTRIKWLLFHRLARRGFRPTFLSNIFDEVNYAIRPVLLAKLQKRETQKSPLVQTPLIFKQRYDPRSRTLHVNAALVPTEQLKADVLYEDIFESKKPITCWLSGKSFLNLLCPTTFRQPVAEAWDHPS